MSKFSKLAVLAALPIIAMTTPVYAADVPATDDQFYGIINMSGDFLSSADARACGEYMTFGIGIHNDGDLPYMNTEVSTTLPSSNGATIVSTATVSAATLPQAGFEVSSTASVNMQPNSHLEYEAGSTSVFSFPDIENQPGNATFVNVDDGIVNGTIGIDDTVPGETKIVTYLVQVICEDEDESNAPAPQTPTPAVVAAANTTNGQAPVVKQSANIPAELVKTGTATNVAAFVAGIVVMSAIAYNVILRRKTNN